MPLRSSLHDLAGGLLAGLPGATGQVVEGKPALATLRRELEARSAAGHDDAAAAACLALLAHPACPPWAATNLARLAMRRRDWAEAAAAWETCLQRFAAHASPAWLVSLYQCHAAAGVPEAAADVLARLRNAFPGAPETLLLSAQSARAAADWRGAVRGFAGYLRLVPQPPRPEALLGMAEGLLRLGRPRAALASWQAAIGRFPDEHSVYQAFINGAAELGQWESVAALSAVRLERFPAKAQADWYAALVRALWNLRREAEADEAMAILAARYPESSQHAMLSIINATRRFFGSEDMYALSLAASRRFPQDRAVQAAHVASLAGRGALPEAAALAQALAAQADDGHALIARWTVAMAQGGSNAIRAEAEALVVQPLGGLHANLAVADFLLRQWLPWSVALTAALLRALDARWPGRPQISVRLAQTLVTLRQDAEAMALLRRVPALYETREVLELRAWGAAREDRFSEARQIWDTLGGQQHAGIRCDRVLGIECDGVDDGAVVDRAAFRIEEERSALAERSARWCRHIPAAGAAPSAEHKDSAN